MPSHLKVQEPNLQWRDEPSHAGPSTSSSSSASNATLLGLETASSGSVSHSLASSSLFDHSVLSIQRSPLVTSLARSVEAAEAAAATGARREPLEVRDPLPKGLARDKGKGRARPPLPVPLGLLTTSEWDETVTTTLRSGEPKNGTRSAREAGYRRLEFARRGLLPVRNRRQQIDAIRQAAGAMEAAFVLDLQQVCHQCLLRGTEDADPSSSPLTFPSGLATRLSRNNSIQSSIALLMLETFEGRRWSSSRRTVSLG